MWRINVHGPNQIAEIEFERVRYMFARSRQSVNHFFRNSRSANCTSLFPSRHGKMSSAWSRLQRPNRTNTVRLEVQPIRDVRMAMVAALRKLEIRGTRLSRVCTFFAYGALSSRDKIPKFDITLVRILFY